MTWRVYAPGSVPDDLDLSSVFRVHTVEGGNQYPEVVL